MEGRLYRYRTSPGSLQAFETPVNHDFKVIKIIEYLETISAIKKCACLIYSMVV